jgi:hypothetical protein
MLINQNTPYSGSVYYFKITFLRLALNCNSQFLFDRYVHQLFKQGNPQPFPPPPLAESMGI